MSITVSLWANKTGEIKKFLEKYYQKNIHMDDDVGKWLNTYRKPLEAVDMISTVLDNSDKFQISVYIQIDEGNLHHVTEENHNSIIKDMFYLFYENAAEHTC